MNEAFGDLRGSQREWKQKRNHKTNKVVSKGRKVFFKEVTQNKAYKRSKPSAKKSTEGQKLFQRA